MADTSQPDRVVLHIDADTTGAEQKITRIEQILNRAEASEKSKVMSIAAIYRRQGMEASEAMQKAWQQVRGSAQGAIAPVQQQVTLFDRLRAKATDISPLARRTSAAVTGGIGGIQTALSALLRTVGAVFSISVIRNFIRESQAAWNVQLEAETKLETVLRRNLGATREQVDAAKEWASELQRVGVIGDEVQLSGLQELSTYIENADSLRTMNVVLNDMLAQQYGLNATAENAVVISTMLGKVLEGQTTALRRYGYSFTDAQEQLLKYGTEEQRVATLAAVVESAVGGMNEALASTPAGQIQQLKNDMGDIREEFGKAATNLHVLLLPALRNSANLLDSIAKKAIEITEVLAGLAGVDLTTDFTGGVAAAVTETDALTESIEAAQEAQEKLKAASFDEFNIIGGDETEAAAAGDSVEPDASGFTESLRGAADDAEAAFSRFSEIFTPIQSAWDKFSPDLLASAQKTADSIKGMFSAIGDSIYNVWTNGTGEEISGEILRIFTNVSDTIGSLNTRFTVAWEDDGMGDKIIQNATDHLGILLGAVEDVSKSTSDWASTLDFSPLLGSFAGLQKSLTPLLDDIGGAVSWVWENIFLPFGKWVIEDALPASLDVLSGALDVLTAAIEPLKEPGQWLWDNFIQPLANWTGEIIVTGLEKLADVLHNIGDWIREHPDAALTIGGLTGAFLGLYTVLSGTMIATAITRLGSFITTLGALDVTIGVIVAGIVSWGYVITELHENWDDITSAFEESGGVFEFLTGWFEYMGEEGTGVFEKLIAGSYQFGQEIYTTIHERIPDFFRRCWQKIKEILSPVGDWFKRIFTGAYENTLGAFRNVGTWFGETFDTARTKVTDAFHSIGNWFGDRWTEVQNAFQNAGTWFGETFGSAWTKVTDAFGSVGNWFGDRWTEVQNAFQNAGTWFGETFGSAWTNISDAFSDVSAFFEDLWGKIKSPFENVAGWFHDIFSDAWQNVLNVFSSGGTVFEGIQAGISSVFTNVVNGLIDGINNALSVPFWNLSEALRVIREWEFAGYYPFEWLPTVDIPQIPRLAKGGIVSQPTLAMVGDNPNAQTDPEVVAPLSGLRGMLSEQNEESPMVLEKLDSLIILLEMLLSSVQDIELPQLHLNDKAVYTAAQRGERRVRRMKGVV